MTTTLRWMSRINARIGDRITAGSWSGNDTIWRMTLDLNHVLYTHGRAKVLHVVDGIVAGQGEGPLQPTPHAAGVIVAGENPAHVDAVLARLAGYNIARIPTVYHALTHRGSRFSTVSQTDIAICQASVGDGPGVTVRLADVPDLGFVTPRHWQRARSRPLDAATARPAAASGDW